MQQAQSEGMHICEKWVRLTKKVLGLSVAAEHEIVDGSTAGCHGPKHSTNVLFCQITGRCRCTQLENGGVELRRA